MTDISPEERFRALTEDSADAIIVLDSRGNITYWGPSAERVVGISSDTMVGTQIFDRVHPEDLESAIAAFEVMTSEPGDIGLDEFRFRDGQGDWRRMELSARNLFDHPEVRGMVLNARDVTRTRALEEHYLRSQRFQAMSRVVQGLAHDFSKLLADIDHEVRTLRDTVAEGSSAWDSAEALMSLIGRGGQLTNDLIVFSADESEGPRPVPVAPLLQRVEEAFRTLVGEGHYLTVASPDAMPPVHGDPVQLEQAILNLVLNARDATPPRGSIELVAEQEADTDFVVISVRDSGSGIPGENLARVFEPFFSTRESGKGLGLTMVKGVVEQAGGRVEVESAPGQGSTFRVHLRVADESLSMTRLPKRDTEVEEALAGADVLLADAQLARRTLIGSALRQHGARVVEVSSGARVPPLLDSEHQEFDLLIAELLGPGITGGELVHALRKRGLSVPVLFLCGQRDDRVDDYLAMNPDVPTLKGPFGPAELIERVRSILEPGTLDSSSEPL